MVLVSLLVYVAVFILSDLLAPKPDVEDARKSSLGDFSFPTATEDRKVPLVWGTVKLSGPNVVWYGDLKQKAITEEVGGGIFSSGETVITGYRYFIAIQFGLCRGSGETVELERIWNSEEIVYDGGTVTPGDDGSTISIDEPKLYGGIKLGSGGIKGDLTFYGGSETQNANPYLETQYDEGGDTPAYRGMCYAVWERGFVGTSTSIRPWEFEVARFPTGLSTTNHKINSNKDASIPHVIYELITNSEWGLSHPASDVDTTSFQDAADTLASEGNGFSFQLESEQGADRLLEELERQMAGKVYIDPQTGLWTIKLARADYSVGTLPIIDESNLIAEESYSRGSWDNTTNDVKVKFADRGLDYKGTFAQAQDLGNQSVQGSINSGAPQFPGVKDAALANNIAWRELRVLTRPLANATLIVDRTFWNTVPMDVVRWNDASKGLSDFVMRVTKVDFGDLRDNRITLTLVEDVFAFAQASFGNPFGTGWTPPSDALVAIPEAEQLVLDAPRAFLMRDPSLAVGAEPAAKFWVGFRAQVGEPGAEIYESNAEFTPNSTFAAAGFVNSTFEIGELTSALDVSGGSFDSFDITPTSGSVLVDILDGMASAPGLSEMGTSLINLIYCEGEFMLVGGVAQNGSDVSFTSVVRGVLDSTPRPHDSGAEVHVICIGGALGEPTFDSDWTVDVRLAPESATTEALSPSLATTVQVDLEDRLKRPYPASQLELNDSIFPSGTVSLDLQHGSTEDTKGLEVQYVRRDFRATNEVDAHGIFVDEGSLPVDFPATNSTEYQITVRNDPDGANTLLLTSAYPASSGDDFSRTAIIKANGGVIPTRLRVEVWTRHTYLPDGVVYTSREALLHDFDVSTTQLGSLVNEGVLDTNVVGSFTAADTGTYTFTIHTSLLSTGVVEAQINGGGYSTVIATSGTTGTLAGVTAGDTVDFRHTQTGSGTTETMLLVKDSALDNEVFAILDI